MSKKFRTGTNLIKEAASAKGGSRRFTPNIWWKDGDVKTVLFLTPADDIPKVRLHQMVRIPDDNQDRGFRYDTFVCRKDPSMLEESSGQCILCDTIGHDASEKFVAMALELDPIREGKRVKSLEVKTNPYKREDGTEVEYPRWGLVIQAPKNFFSWLAAYDEAKGDITSKAFEIQREGESIGTKYHFFPEDAPIPDLTDVQDDIPDLFSLLETMGSDEKYATLSEVEPGSQPSWDGPTVTPDATETRQLQFDKLKDEVGAAY